MIEGEFDNEHVEVCCVGKGTSSCEEIVKAKMAEIRRICDIPHAILVLLLYVRLTGTPKTLHLGSLNIILYHSWWPHPPWSLGVILPLE